jgi:outer membrane protein assembly factor BamB
MAVSSFVFAGINGSVIAVDETTGVQVWATRLKGSDFVNLVMSENKLYATTKGEIFCLNPGTGKILWQNPLKGMGRGIVCLAAPGAQVNLAAAIKRKKDQDDAAATTVIAAGGS